MAAEPTAGAPDPGPPGAPDPGVQSPGPSRSRSGAWFLLAAVVTLVLGLVGALETTLVPRSLDDNLRGIAQPDDGPEYVTFYTDESGAVPAYSVVVDRFGGPGLLYGQQRMYKEPWSRTLTVGELSVDLAPPRAFYEYLAVLGLLVAVAILRWQRRPRA